MLTCECRKTITVWRHSPKCVQQRSLLVYDWLISGQLNTSRVNDWWMVIQPQETWRVSNFMGGVPVFWLWWSCLSKHSIALRGFFLGTAASSHTSKTCMLNSFTSLTFLIFAPADEQLLAFLKSVTTIRITRRGCKGNVVTRQGSSHGFFMIGFYLILIELF